MSHDSYRPDTNTSHRWLVSKLGGTEPYPRSSATPTDETHPLEVSEPTDEPPVAPRRRRTHRAPVIIDLRDLS